MKIYGPKHGGVVENNIHFITGTSWKVKNIDTFKRTEKYVLLFPIINDNANY